MVVFILTLIRHGETKANKENVIQGQSDVPLSDTGVRQAHLLAQRLQNQIYSHVFASDLSRAKQTAQTILDESNQTKCTIVQESRLRERKFGDVEGKHVSELRKLANYAHQSIPNFTPSGGETLQQVRERAILFFHELCHLIRSASDKTEKTKLEERELFSHVMAGIKRRRRHNSYGENIFVKLIPSEKLETKTLINEPKESISSDPLMGDTIPKAYPLSASNGNEKELCVYVPSKCQSKSRTNIASADGASVDAINIVHNGEVSANVLVVSHGGLLKELICHFVEDLGCTIPGGKMQAFKISPNTGLSKFSVCISNDDSLPNVTCHLIHDNHHLLHNDADNEDERLK